MSPRAALRTWGVCVWAFGVAHPPAVQIAVVLLWWVAIRSNTPGSTPAKVPEVLLVRWRIPPGALRGGPRGVSSGVAGIPLGPSAEGPGVCPAAAGTGTCVLTVIYTYAAWPGWLGTAYVDNCALGRAWWLATGLVPKFIYGFSYLLRYLL